MASSPERTLSTSYPSSSSSCVIAIPINFSSSTTSIFWRAIGSPLYKNSFISQFLHQIPRNLRKDIFFQRLAEHFIAPAGLHELLLLQGNFIRTAGKKNHFRLR